MKRPSYISHRNIRGALLAQAMASGAAVAAGVGLSMHGANLGAALGSAAAVLVAGLGWTGWRLRTLVRWDARLARLEDAAIDPFSLERASGSSPAERGWNRLVDQGRRWQALTEVEDALQQRLNGHGLSDASSLLDAVADGIAAVDVDGRITLANATMAGLCGVDSPDDLVGKGVADALRFDETTARQFDAAAQSQIVAQWSVASSGDTSTSRIRRGVRRPLADGGTSGGAFVWTVRDVTQQCLAESMREQFLSAATHEFRTPLANIRAYAESLGMGHDVDADSRKHFYNIIQSESVRLSQLVDDLLDISRMQAGSMSLDSRETDLGRLVEEATAKVAGAMREKAITFRCEFPPKYPKIIADKSKLTAALVNLLGNAAKYTPEGGKVTFRVEVASQRVLFSVTDTGIGIAPEELSQVFDRFFRSSDERVRGVTGSGLGLALAQEIARLHGGELTVESTLNKGSTFRMTIPMDPPA